MDAYGNCPLYSPISLSPDKTILQEDLDKSKLNHPTSFEAYIENRSFIVGFINSPPQ